MAVLAGGKMFSQSGQLGLIVKSTRKCNLRCAYCHDWRSSSVMMPFEVLVALIAKALSAPDVNVVQFIWHGGEPLLLGRMFYLKALRLQQEFRQDNQVVVNSLQTNGTLIDEVWCRFFKEWGFHIGVSIDGPEALHNRNRRYASGKGSFFDVRQGIQLLQEYDIPFGVLMVVNADTILMDPKMIFEFLTQELGVSCFAFLPVRPPNFPDKKDGGDYISLYDYCIFMQGVFDAWYELDDPSIRIRELISILDAVVGGSPHMCTLTGNCYGEYFHVEPNGDLFHCDRFFGDPQYQVGNILQNGFPEVWQSKRLQSLLEGENQQLQKLKACQWFHVCHGGCPHDRYIAAKYAADYDGVCCGMDTLIEYIYQRVNADVTRALIQNAEPDGKHTGVEEWHAPICV